MGGKYSALSTFFTSTTCNNNPKSKNSKKNRDEGEIGWGGEQYDAKVRHQTRRRRHWGKRTPEPPEHLVVDLQLLPSRHRLGQPPLRPCYRSSRCLPPSAILPALPPPNTAPPNSSSAAKRRGKVRWRWRRRRGKGPWWRPVARWRDSGVGLRFDLLFKKKKSYYLRRPFCKSVLVRLQNYNRIYGHKFVLKRSQIYNGTAVEKWPSLKTCLILVLLLTNQILGSLGKENIYHEVNS